MSRKDPNDGLTDEQQAFEERFTAQCANNFRNLSTQLQAGCVNNARYRQILKQAEVNKAELERMQRQISFVEQKGDARSIVNEWVDKWQTHASLILSAVMMASENYNLILNTRASQSIAFGLITDLAILFVPELLPLQSVFKVLIKKKYADKFLKEADSMLRIQRTWIDKAISSNARIDKIYSGANQIDKRADDIIGAIRSNVSSNQGIDAASQQLAAAYNAKNQIFREILGNAMSNLIMVTNLASVYYYMIDTISSVDMKTVILNLIKWTDFDNTIIPALSAGKYEMLSDQILYDMLRAYVKANFVVNTGSESGITTIEAMPDKYGESAISGLDGAQRQMIYDKFGKVSWSDTSRPPVNNYKDLIRLWKGTLQVVYPTAAEIADRYKPY